VETPLTSNLIAEITKTVEVEPEVARVLIISFLEDAEKDDVVLYRLPGQVEAEGDQLDNVDRDKLVDRFTKANANNVLRYH
jgi:hypothetical protein